MRRSNLFWSLKKGGFGLINVELKLTIQRLQHSWDHCGTFLLAATQCSGAVHLAPLLATTGPLCFGTRATTFHKEVAQALALLEQHFSWEDPLTATPRKLYWDLVYEVLPRPLYRQPPSCDNVLKRVRTLPVLKGSNDFFFRLHMGVLPSKARFKDRGLFVHDSTGCLLCGQREMAEHVPIQCNTVNIFWDKLQTSFTERWELTWSHLHRLNAPSKNKVLQDCVLVLGLHSLCRARVDVPYTTPQPQRPSYTTLAAPGRHGGTFW